MAADRLEHVVGDTLLGAKKDNERFRSWQSVVADVIRPLSGNRAARLMVHAHNQQFVSMTLVVDPKRVGQTSGAVIVKWTPTNSRRS
jgi:hypothetical protein